MQGYPKWLVSVRGHETPFHNQRPSAKGGEVCSGADEPRCLLVVTARGSSPETDQARRSSVIGAACQFLS